MRYFVKVAYDGTNYAGWQHQPGKKTIQLAIEEALEKIVHKKVMIHGSGRTDAKVHALGQRFHFDSDNKMTSEQWLRALNALLPKDIVAKDVTQVDDQAHCRRDAVEKHYEYWLNMGEYNLFERNIINQVNRKLDLQAMKKASSYFIGTHDFSSFCANTKEEKENQVRTIFDIQWIEKEDKVGIRFIGNGFMRYMIRMLVGSLIEVGKNKVVPEHVKMVLEQKDKNACNYNCDPCGLYLVDVKYEK